MVYPIQTVHVARLKPHEGNYNTHPPQQVTRLIASLLAFGQFRPIIVQHNTVIAGHGVVAAAKVLGWQTLEAVVLPDTLDEHTIRGVLLADNELAKLAIVDNAQLAMLLEEQRQDGRDLMAVGSSDDELNKLVTKVERSIDLQGKLGDTLERCPECGQIRRIKGLTQ